MNSEQSDHCEVKCTIKGIKNFSHLYMYGEGMHLSGSVRIKKLNIFDGMKLFDEIFRNSPTPNK